MKTHIEFTQRPIEIPSPGFLGCETGAEIEFRGIVRKTERGHAIAGLQYEAYVPMAKRQLEKIFEELGGTHPCQAVWFIHRLGWVPVCEVSLYIRIHALNRQPAFQFTMGLIDLLKKDVPVWKVGTAPPVA